MSTMEIAETARRLFYAQKNRSRVDLITKLHPDLTMGDAYNIARQTKKLNALPMTGYKLGFTSAAMRKQMNIAAPNYGCLTQDLDLGLQSNRKLVHPRIEPEVTLLIGSDIFEVPKTPVACWSYIDAIIPSLEIVDTRYHRYDFTLPDNTADNSSAAGYVLGERHKPEAILDHQISVQLSMGNAEVLSGSSDDALGGPVKALHWLCQQLISRGEIIKAGSLIMTGGLTPAPYLEPQTSISAYFGKLGSVSFTWEA